MVKQSCQNYRFNWKEALAENLLTEARKDFMSKEEKRLKRKLIKLLKDDGKGHHHAAYAKRLSLYDVNIVPLGKEPSTAAISFDEGVIYINRGFLVGDEDTFYQLNVILRHELCHNLLMHQFRMIKKLEAIIPEKHLTTSASIHELLNILEDFEISNKKYSAEDKETVRNTWLNGKLLSGLITEDHRAAWLSMPLEKMYDKIVEEMDIHGNTGEINPPEVNKYNKYGDPLNLDVAAANLHNYKNKADEPSDFESIKDMRAALLAKALKYDKNAKLPDVWEDIMDALQKSIVDDPDNGYSQQDIAEMIKQVTSSKALAQCDVVSPVTGEVITTVYTPEEKWLAVECLNIIGGNTRYSKDFQAWYNEIMKKIGNGSFTEDQIKELAGIVGVK